jgi:TonB-dependent SusC/RagA subfamily outer membrane receptor
MMVSFLWPALPLEDWFFKAPQITQVVYIPVSAFMFQFKPKPPTFGIEQFLKICYFGGVLFMLIRLGVQIVSLRKVFKRSEKQVIQDVTVRAVNEKINPFSFFGQIFLNPANHSATELTAILQHEKVHNHRAHSIDILLSELVKITLWFNPFSWLFCKVVKENIEFEVDRILLHQGIDCKTYQYSLLKLSTIKNQNPITNHFNLSNLKIRIIMMNKKQSSRYGLATYALVIPILLFSMVISVAFAQNKLPGKKSNSKTTSVSFLLDVFSGKKPLILLDGKEIDKKTMDKIPADEILTVNIFKNEDATKRYGDKGKDGVIMITSKSGAKIALDKKQYDVKLDAEKLSTEKIALDKKQYDEKVYSEGVAKINSGFPDNVYVEIDGVPADKDGLNHLDPARIESMDVLKGEKATSVYGEKGKGGVIRITTRKISLNLSPAGSSSSSSSISSLGNVIVVGNGSSTGSSVDVTGFKKPVVSPKDAYILLDGKEINSDQMEAINPEDILTVDVLKDKSATAIYGEKGKKGVILITLKKK